jgi:hypothetical protein
MPPPERKALSKRTRFEIFKRDGFRCVYCGATPNDSPLHVDHVHPVAEGGATVETNLVTACQSCNGGKSAVPLDRKKFQPIDPELAADHADQIREWVAAQAEVLQAKRDAEQHWVNFWCEAMGTNQCASDIPKRIDKVVSEFGFEKVSEAVAIVAAKRGLSSDTKRLQYLYGILRTWRQQRQFEESQKVQEHPCLPWIRAIRAAFLDHGGVY